MGPNPAATFRAVGAETGRTTPEQIPATLSPGQALVWFRGRHEPAFRVRAASPRGEHRRHVRKYAAGDLGPEGSFHFRGPEGRLNLGAQNRALSGMETENAASPAAEPRRTDHAGGPTRRE
jgi:hypothetical protein